MWLQWSTVIAVAVITNNLYGYLTNVRSYTSLGGHVIWGYITWDISINGLVLNHTHNGCGGGGGGGEGRSNQNGICILIYSVWSRRACMQSRPKIIRTTAKRLSRG